MGYIDDCNYYGDHRVRAGERGSPFLRIDTGRKQGVIVLYEGDEETEVTVPITFEVCPTCDGAGSHVNPSIDAGGLSAEDFYEDPDFAEAYMEGCYDVPCYGCGGERVVPVIARERLDAELLKKIDAKEKADADYRREVEAERRMGC